MPLGACSRSPPKRRSQLLLPRLVSSRDPAEDQHWYLRQDGRSGAVQDTLQLDSKKPPRYSGGVRVGPPAGWLFISGMGGFFHRNTHKETRSARKRSKNGPLRRPLAIGDSMTTLGSSVQTLGNLLHTHDLYDHLRAVPPAIAPYADPLNFCSPRIAARCGGSPPGLDRLGYGLVVSGLGLHPCCCVARPQPRLVAR